MEIKRREYNVGHQGQGRGGKFETSIRELRIELFCTQSWNWGPVSDLNKLVNKLEGPGGPEGAALSSVSVIIPSETSGPAARRFLSGELWGSSGGLESEGERGRGKD